jgi:hypothetical protein
MLVIYALYLMPWLEVEVFVVEMEEIMAIMVRGGCW